MMIFGRNPSGGSSAKTAISQSRNTTNKVRVDMFGQLPSVTGNHTRFLDRNLGWSCSMATPVKLQSTSYSINNSARPSTSNLYRSCCCFICIRSNGVSSLIGPTLLTSHSPLSTPTEGFHRARRSTIIEQKVSLKLTLCSVIISFTQYLQYAMLSSFYPLFESNIIEVGVVIAIFPFICLLVTPLIRRFSLVHKLGTSHCMIIGLILQSVLCALFGAGPYIMDRSVSEFMDTPHIFFIASMIIRIVTAFLSILIQLSMLSMIHLFTPRPLFKSPQLITLFSWIGLIASPFLSGYLYVFGYDITSDDNSSDRNSNADTNGSNSDSDSATNSHPENVGYLIAFCGIALLILICALIVRYLINTIRIKRPSAPIVVSTKSALCIGDLNVIFSSILALCTTISISLLLSILAFYVLDGEYEGNDGAYGDAMSHLSTKFLFLGGSFIVSSFIANHLIDKTWGSLSTMLLGSIGMSIGMMLLSECHPFHRYYFEAEDVIQKSEITLLVGLGVVGSSSAFTLTPFLLYLKNALTPKYKDHAMTMALEVDYIILNVGLCIGPIAGTLISDVAGLHGVSCALFVLSMITVTLSIAGILMLKCLRWNRITFDSKHSPLLRGAEDGEEHSVTISKIDLMQRSLSGSSSNTQKIQYRFVLQDDKSCGCLCTHSLFFSFGAIYDNSKHGNPDIHDQFTQRNSREKCRGSFVDPGYLTYHYGDSTGSGGPQKITSLNSKENLARNSKYQLVDTDYHHHYKGHKDTTTKPLLAQSWNTLLRGGMHPNGSNQSLLVVPDTDPLEDSLISTQSSAPKKASREKSKILDIDTESHQDEEHEIEMSKSVSGNTMSGDTHHGMNMKRPHDVVTPPYIGHGANGVNAVNGVNGQSHYHHHHHQQMRPGPAIPISGSGRKSSTSLGYYHANHHVSHSRRGMNGHRGFGANNNHISESMSQRTMTTDKESQTFLLLSDEDFASLREDTDDIYRAPEVYEESYGQ